MKQKITAILLLFLLSNALSAQRPASLKDWYFKFAGGYVSFGTGVISNTYGVGLDISKNVVKQPRMGMGRLLVGAEWLFEQGTTSPKMGLLSPGDWVGSSFSHVSVNTLWPKVSYYPFPKILSGFNVQLGPTIGHTFYSYSTSSSTLSLPEGELFRRDVVEYDHGIRVGYRISTGYEIIVRKKWIVGFRGDFSNTQKGEINTMLGLKGGIRF